MNRAGGSSGTSTSPEIHYFRAIAGQTSTRLDGRRAAAPLPGPPSHSLFNRINGHCFELFAGRSLWRACAKNRNWRKCRGAKHQGI